MTISIEFHPHRVMVKDLQTNEVLIEGDSSDSLYELSIQINHTMQVNQTMMGGRHPLAPDIIIWDIYIVELYKHWLERM